MENKKSPLRMCIACHEMKDKRELVRIVKNSDNQIFIDCTGKKNGRGAYLCDNPDCVKKCVKSRLVNKAFKCEVSQEVYQKILEDYSIAKRQD